ncbi:MAG: beta-propeller domain-containing protein [Nitrososphaerales archaeon]
MESQARKYSVYAAVATAAVIGLIVGWIAAINVEDDVPFTLDKDIFSNDTLSFSFDSTQSLKKFSSHEELRAFLLKVADRQIIDAGRFDFREELALPSVIQSPPLEKIPMSDTTGEYGSGLIDFSTTNVQVKDVDEPDFLKNDGKYVYILSNDKLTIIDAYPPENATIIAKVALDVQRQNLQNMFLNNDRLIIFYQSNEPDYIIERYGYQPVPVYSPKTHALVLDISDREDPKTVKNYEVRGYYREARMIGDHVYFVTRSDIDYHRPIVPGIMESSRTVMVPDVYYFDNPDLYYAFNTVTAIDIFGDKINAETFMMDSAGTIYVSEDSIFITYSKYLPYAFHNTWSKEKFFKVVVPLLPNDLQDKILAIDNSDLDPDEKWSKVSDLLQETYNEMPENEKRTLFSKIQKALEEYEVRLLQETQKTVIHKIGFDRLVLNDVFTAEVPGNVLNQFSMDEFDNKFRIATTSEFYTSKGRTMHNNVYVLDDDLEIVGKLEGIAPDESIYSARFMANKLYMVTFRQIDPFFVIDLSKDNPEILGYLKIPGFSNYLHPYDENHIIGIGRDTKENKWGGVSTLGVKIALFDVSDVSNPVEVDVFIVGDQQTNSEALYDHKAFLFDKKKNILSIPILSNEYRITPMEHEYIAPSSWFGFYVLGVDAKDGFTLKGKVNHSNDHDAVPYHGYGGYGSRSFYIGDVLYTVTNQLMKMNDLEDITEINQIKLVNTGEVIKYVD